MKRTFSYKEYPDDVLDKFSHVLTENFPSPNPALSKSCFENLVRKNVLKMDYMPKVSCLQPSDMASFFFKTAHVFQQLNASQHSFFSEFTHTQARLQSHLDRAPRSMSPPSNF